MSRYLFTSWDGAGAIPPLMSLAGALVERGHDVRVLGDAAIADEIRAAGAEPIAWTRAPQRTSEDPRDHISPDWDTRSPLVVLGRVRDRILCGPAADYAADVLAEVQRHPVDAIVNDAVLLGAHCAAQSLGLPWAVAIPNVYPLQAPGRPPFGSGWQAPKGPIGRTRDRAFTRFGNRLMAKGLPALNGARAELGVPPVAHPFDTLLAADRVLVLTSSAFDLGTAGLPANVRMCGPRLEDPAWAGDRWTPPPGDAPLVLVSLSSSFQGQLEVLRRIAVGLSSEPVRAVVTTGLAIDPADVPAGPNVQVVRTASHAEVLRHASAVVTHGGHGTTIKALAAGIPVVCLPMGRDQPDTAARLVASAAGVRVRPNARPATVARAVRRVLTDPSFALAAGRLAEAIAADTARDTAVQELEALAGEPALASFAPTASRPRP